jgi:hypothetical protein
LCKCYLHAALAPVQGVSTNKVAAAIAAGWLPPMGTFREAGSSSSPRSHEPQDSKGTAPVHHLVTPSASHSSQVLHLTPSPSSSSASAAVIRHAPPRSPAALSVPQPAAQEPGVVHSNGLEQGRAVVKGENTAMSTSGPASLRTASVTGSADTPSITGKATRNGLRLLSVTDLLRRRPSPPRSHTAAGSDGGVLASQELQGAKDRLAAGGAEAMGVTSVSSTQYGGAGAQEVEAASAASAPAFAGTSDTPQGGLAAKAGGDTAETEAGADLASAAEATGSVSFVHAYEHGVVPALDTGRAGGGRRSRSSQIASLLAR